MSCVLYSQQGNAGEVGYAYSSSAPLLGLVQRVEREILQVSICSDAETRA